MEPVAWMYERKPDAWPPARPIVRFNRWDDDDAAREFWTETPLYAHPDTRAHTEGYEAAVRDVVAWLRGRALSAWGADCSGDSETTFYANAIERGEFKP